MLAEPQSDAEEEAVMLLQLDGDTVLVPEAQADAVVHALSHALAELTELPDIDKGEARALPEPI